MITLNTNGGDRDKNEALTHIVNSHNASVVVLTETHEYSYKLRGFNSYRNSGEPHTGGIQILVRGLSEGTRWHDMDT